MDPLLGGGSADMRKATTMSDTMRTIGFIGAWVVLITTLLQFAPELLRKQRGRFGLEPGEFLPAGQEIESPHGRHVLHMERDGNLVLWEDVVKRHRRHRPGCSRARRRSDAGVRRRRQHPPRPAPPGHLTAGNPQFSVWVRARCR